MGSGYSLRQYGLMIGDPIRMAAYDGAMKHAIRPGDVVADLGTGTGLLAMRAVQLGASKVYAIDLDSSIWMAEKLAAANKMGRQIEFIQSDSREVNLPVKVDVLVTDLRGVLPLNGQHIAVLADARDRWLKPDGRLLPASDRLFVAAVESPALHDQCVRPWAANHFNLDLSILENHHRNTWLKARVDKHALLSSPQCWATLDYSTIRDSGVRGTTTLIVQREGMMHGASIWFDAMIDADHGFSNAPACVPTGYSMAFFPMPAAAAVHPGDTIDYRIDARLIGDDYVWSWSTTIKRGNHVIAQHDQSNVYASLLSRKPQP